MMISCILFPAQAGSPPHEAGGGVRIEPCVSQMTLDVFRPAFTFINNCEVVERDTTTVHRSQSKHRANASDKCIHLEATAK